MNNVDQWQPTKFVMTKYGLRASRNKKHMSVGSRFFADIQAQKYQSLIREHATGRLLDLGCGHVPLYRIYADLVSATTCVDWENSLHNNPFLDETCDLAQELPFPDASFDTVLMTDVLEHLPEPLLVMRRISAVLNTSGKLVLSVPFFYWLHEEPHDYYRYTEFALRRFCEIAGLRIIQLEAYGGLPEVMLDLCSKGITLLPRALERLVRPLHSATATLRTTLPGRKLSKGTSASFPLGYILVAEKPSF